MKSPLTLASVFPFQKTMYCLIIIFAVMGGVDAIMHNIISSCLQLNTDKDFRGVVFSLYSLMNNVMKPISISVGGVLGEYFHIGKVITITMLVGIITLFLYFRNNDLLDFMTIYKDTD